MGTIETIVVHVVTHVFVTHDEAVGVELSKAVTNWPSSLGVGLYKCMTVRCLPAMSTKTIGFIFIPIYVYLRGLSSQTHVYTLPKQFRLVVIVYYMLLLVQILIFFCVNVLCATKPFKRYAYERSVCLYVFRCQNSYISFQLFFLILFVALDYCFLYDYTQLFSSFKISRRRDGQQYKP